MLKPLLTLLCSCAISFLYAQELRYSFNGNLTADELHRLNDTLKQLPIAAHRIHLKPDQSFGEVVFQMEALPHFDSPQLFSSVDIKKILLEFGLFPLGCIDLTKTEEP
jgi:hypothetical protein